MQLEMWMERRVGGEGAAASRRTNRGGHSCGCDRCHLRLRRRFDQPEESEGRRETDESEASLVDSDCSTSLPANAVDGHLEGAGHLAEPGNGMLEAAVRLGAFPPVPRAAPFSC